MTATRGPGAELAEQLDTMARAAWLAASTLGGCPQRPERIALAERLSAWCVPDGHPRDAEHVQVCADRLAVVGAEMAELAKRLAVLRGEVLELVPRVAPLAAHRFADCDGDGCPVCDLGYVREWLSGDYWLMPDMGRSVVVWLAARLADGVDLSRMVGALQTAAHLTAFRLPWRPGVMDGT